MNNCLIPGSFDPPTYGHLNIIQRASELFDKVCVLICINPEKSYLFSEEERKCILEELTEKYDNVYIDIWKGLTVDYAKKNNIKTIVRGIREKDICYEMNLSKIYKSSWNELDVIFFPADTNYSDVSSTMLKDKIFLGKDVSGYAPESVLNILKKKLKC